MCTIVSVLPMTCYTVYRFAQCPKLLFQGIFFLIDKLDWIQIHSVLVCVPLHGEKVENMSSRTVKL